MGPISRYSLGEAARAADATEEELLRAIEDRLLLARTEENGEVTIQATDLADWLRRTRHADRLRIAKKKKVLVLGEDTAFAGTLKLELSRNEGIDIRYATWGADAILLVNHYKADLYLVDLSSRVVAPDVVLSAVASQRAQDRGSLIATSAEPQEVVEAHPLLGSRLGSLAPDAFISRAGSMRPLLVAIFATLGLETKTRIMKRQS